MTEAQEGGWWKISEGQRGYWSNVGWYNGIKDWNKVHWSGA